MTENEIRKAMGCCANFDDCSECDFEECKIHSIPKSIIDLIKRQKAEIERLKSDLGIWKDIAHRETSYVTIAKSEAYKEIVEKLKGHLCSYDLPDYHSFRAVDEDVIDEVLEELVGDK